MLDDNMYKNQNETEDKFLKIVKTIKIKGYKLIKTKDNFFIWKAGKGSHYIRLVLISTGFKEVLFYWNLELDFKPFSKRQGLQFQSDKFKVKEEDKFYNYFLDMVKKIKQR